MNELKRVIGPLGAVGFGLGAMVGTGVFVYTGHAAGLAGPAVLASLLLAGVAAACNGLSSAELAAAHPVSGGTYEYARRRLAPWAGFLAGWLFLAAKTTSAAATALGFGAYLGAVTRLPPLAWTLALLVGITALNLFRLTAAGRFNLALVAFSVATLLAFVATGLPEVSTSRFTPFAPKGLGGVLSAAALLFVAYAGYGRIATMGEEVENPRRTIPMAVGVALAVAAALYLSVTYVAVGTIGAEAFAGAAAGGAPLEAAAGRGWVRGALAAGAATALGSVFLNLLLGLSRMSFAMARGGDLPWALARVNAASSPWVSVLAVGGVVGALVAWGSVKGLVTLSAFTILAYYGLTNLSALRLSREERLVPPWVPAAGLLFCGALAFSLPRRELAIGAGVLAAGLLYRAARRATGSEES